MMKISGRSLSPTPLGTGCLRLFWFSNQD